MEWQKQAEQTIAEVEIVSPHRKAEKVNLLDLATLEGSTEKPLGLGLGLGF